MMRRTELEQACPQRQSIATLSLHPEIGALERNPFRNAPPVLRLGRGSAQDYEIELARRIQRELLL